MAHKIGVVERDEIDRIGWVAALGATGATVVGAASPEETSSWGDDAWCRFDTMLIGITADPSRWDRYGCVETVVEARRANPNLRVIALYDTEMPPLVHRRLQLSGVGRIWSTHATRTIDDLATLMATRPHAGDGRKPPCYNIRAATVGHRTDPAKVLGYVIERDLTGVFDRVETQADTGLSRRQIIRLRRDISELADLSVPSGYATGGPVVDRSLPSWKACVEYVNRARGVGHAAVVLPSRFRQDLVASA